MIIYEYIFFFSFFLVFSLSSKCLSVATNDHISRTLKSQGSCAVFFCLLGLDLKMRLHSIFLLPCSAFCAVFFVLDILSQLSQLSLPRCAVFFVLDILSQLSQLSLHTLRCIFCFQENRPRL